MIDRMETWRNERLNPFYQVVESIERGLVQKGVEVITQSQSLLSSRGINLGGVNGVL